MSDAGNRCEIGGNTAAVTTGMLQTMVIAQDHGGASCVHTLARFGKASRPGDGMQEFHNIGATLRCNTRDWARFPPVGQ